MVGCGLGRGPWIISSAQALPSPCWAQPGHHCRDGSEEFCFLFSGLVSSSAGNRSHCWPRRIAGICELLLSSAPTIQLIKLGASQSSPMSELKISFTHLPVSKCPKKGILY